MKSNRKPAPFREAFCARFPCHSDEYELSVFWRCLYPHAMLVAWFLIWWKPDFFKEDFDLIREVGDICDPELFTSELNIFHGRNMRDQNWIRRAFCIRISAGRLIRLKNEVYAHPLLAFALSR